MPICLILFRQEIFWAWLLDFARAGNSSAARIAMMAITTNSSISVNATDCMFAFRSLRIFVVVSAVHARMSLTTFPKTSVSR